MGKIIYWEKGKMDVELIGEHQYVISQAKISDPSKTARVYLNMSQLLEILKEREVKVDK